MTRKGKIARLPREIREELNRRLEDVAAGEPLLDWLNALPAGEKTDAEVVAQFEEWAKVPAVKDWICQDWESPDERRRRLLEIFGRAPEPKEPAAPDPQPKTTQPDQSGVPAGDASDSDQTAPPNPVQNPAAFALEIPAAETESNQVKPKTEWPPISAASPKLFC